MTHFPFTSPLEFNSRTAPAQPTRFANQPVVNRAEAPLQQGQMQEELPFDIFNSFCRSSEDPNIKRERRIKLREVMRTGEPKEDIPVSAEMARSVRDEAYSKEINPTVKNLFGLEQDSLENNENKAKVVQKLEEHLPQFFKIVTGLLKREDCIYPIDAPYSEFAHTILKDFEIYTQARLMTNDTAEGQNARGLLDKLWEMAYITDSLLIKKLSDTNIQGLDQGFDKAKQVKAEKTIQAMQALWAEQAGQAEEVNQTIEAMQARHQALQDIQVELTEQTERARQVEQSKKVEEVKKAWKELKKEKLDDTKDDILCVGIPQSNSLNEEPYKARKGYEVVENMRSNVDVVSSHIGYPVVSEMQEGIYTPKQIHQFVFRLDEDLK